ncbi:MAG: class I SAM-dependent methyltransferase [Acidobacteria bacterium]|nr:class I SAM-dependent methyltransferase [Acidobacteriota bacterium]
MNMAIHLAERAILPDFLIRLGIRRLLSERIRARKNHQDALNSYEKSFAHQLTKEPIAVETDAANQQHYEVPAAFFRLVLGKHLKYSSAFFPNTLTGLDQAEQSMLELTMERAQLKNGDSILELGCGWGSLTLAMATRFPEAQITALSNSSSQKAFIDQECLKRGLTNVRVLTANIVHWQNDACFDRVVSVEMFEHMRNYDQLLNRINTWLKPGGTLFVHIFCHKDFPYLFETEGEDNWMGRYFFTGGQMPSSSLFHHFQKDLKLLQHWQVPGIHYGLTAEAWLKKADQNKREILRIFEQVYGAHQSRTWFQRWRMFFMACAELFSWSNGQEWLVGHYLFQKHPN